jgi:radical SAM superfamily enzyme YgiQ (UPF0313 family)
MHLMVGANIDCVFVGIESPSEEALRETKKIQNLADRHGTMLEKVHRIQQAGLEVWSGMIVGFDADDERVFAQQRRFVEQAHIVQAMINTLVAIPRTPLFSRLAREGRLDESGEAGDWGTIGTNVVPRRISRAALCDGYLDLMRDLYRPEAYFARLDALYLDGGLLPALGRRRYLRRHPWRRLKLRGRSAVETLFVFIQMMRLVPDIDLRRQYRSRLWPVLKRRPHIALLRLYCVKCALHFHADRLVKEMFAARAARAVKVDGDSPGSQETTPAAA